MRYYPIHIFIKDISFWILFFLMVKFINHNDYLFRTEWWTTKEIIGSSIYMSIGFSVINILIFSLIYWIFKNKEIQTDSFYFGAGLHIITLILIWANVDLTERHLSYWIAGMISLLISGFIYKKLNSRFSMETR